MVGVKENQCLRICFRYSWGLCSPSGGGVSSAETQPKLWAESAARSPEEASLCSPQPHRVPGEWEALGLGLEGAYVTSKCVCALEGGLSFSRGPQLGRGPLNRPHSGLRAPRPRRGWSFSSPSFRTPVGHRNPEQPTRGAVTRRWASPVVPGADWVPRPGGRAQPGLPLNSWPTVHLFQHGLPCRLLIPEKQG